MSIVPLVMSMAGAAIVLAWRVQETRRPISLRRIVLPPMGMATGFSMFLLPMFRVPWTWGIAAFLTGAVALAYPLLWTSKLVRRGDDVLLQRSNAFLAVVLALATVRIGARGYLDTLLTMQQTAALFFLLAFGMILRWRTQMLLQYRALAVVSPR